MFGVGYFQNGKGATEFERYIFRKALNLIVPNIALVREFMATYPVLETNRALKKQTFAPL